MGAIYPVDFEAPEGWGRFVVPSEAGVQLLAEVEPLHEGLSKADLHLALFCHFTHHDLLVDPSSSDLRSCLAMIGQSLTGGSLLLPHIHGRELYDRFNSDFETDRTENLSPEEGTAFLKGSSVGVYQIGTLVSGPFGLQRSAESRMTPPSNRAPLWHCSDTGCSALHFVTLPDGECKPVLAFRALAQAASRLWGQPSEWQRPLYDRSLHRTRDTEVALYDLLSFLGYCIVGKDSEVLVEQALRGDSGQELRVALSSVPRWSDISKRRPSTIAEEMSEAERLQLLAMMRNEELVSLIDRCVAEGLITVQPEELRRAIVGPLPGARDLRTELSSLGLRSHRPRPIVRLRTRILHLYEAKGILDELDWRLRKPSSQTSADALGEFLSTKGPEAAVRELVLVERSVFEPLAEEVGLLGETSLTDPDLSSRLLWKLGFVVPRYGRSLELLRRRLDEFNSILLEVRSVGSEPERERIRSAGVNLFVSVEDFLERLVSFNIWLNASDHFLSTRFAYDRQAAVASVWKNLPAKLETGGTESTWSPEGRNALGTLEAYAAELSRWLESLHTVDRAPLRRTDDDLPHYANRPSQIFPFKHTAAWADWDLNEFRRYAGVVGAVVDQILKAKLSYVRNGLDHNRRGAQFPDIETMLALVARLREALDKADANRLVPKRFWMVSRTVERSGQGKQLLQDYSGRIVEVPTPCAVVGMPSVNFDVPVVLGPGSLLGEAEGPLVFSVKGSGEFARYWAGYPKRRRIPSPHTKKDVDSEGDDKDS